MGDEEGEREGWMNRRKRISLEQVSFFGKIDPDQMVRRCNVGEEFVEKEIERERESTTSHLLKNSQSVSEFSSKYPHSGERKLRKPRG